jgi:hypothetical protein
MYMNPRTLFRVIAQQSNTTAMATHISEMPALPINQRPAAVHAPEKGSPRPTRGDRTHPPILHTMNTNRPPHPTVNILLPVEIMAVRFPPSASK